MVFKKRNHCRNIASLCLSILELFTVIQIVLTQNGPSNKKRSKGEIVEDFKLMHTRQTILTEEENKILIADASEDKFEFNQVPENATVDFGSSHALFCKTTRSDADIVWLKQNTILHEKTLLPNLKLLNKNTLWINSMDYQLSGTYTCVATLSTQSIKIQVNILVKNESDKNASCSSILPIIPKQSYFVEGEFAYLECLTKDLSIQVFWEENGQRLEFTNYIGVMKRGYLFFVSLKVEDAGIYSCVGKDPITNCTGKVSALLQINLKSNIDEICGNVRAKEAFEKEKIDRVVNSHTAKKGSHPWHATIILQTEIYWSGVLLNNRWIATAAYHTSLTGELLDWYRFEVVLGKYERYIDEKQDYTTALAEFLSIIIHPHFKVNEYKRHNIALIRLRESIRFTDYIIPICLGDKNLGKSLMTPNNIGVVAGWNYNSEGSSIGKNRLQEINIPIAEDKLCSEIYFEMNDGIFCAGYSENDTEDVCHGDTGAPFVIHHKDKWYLMGLFSFGDVCSTEGKYGHYIKVPYYLDWIKFIIEF